jgi:hypothetical protein
MRTLKQLRPLIFICVVALGWTRSAIAQTSNLDWCEFKSADGGFTQVSQFFSAIRVSPK